MDNRLAMLSRGFLGGNPAGPIMDIVGGAISKGGDALSAVEKYAQMVAQQKAQEAATTPEAQFDMEAMRKQLGEAPDVFTAPEGMKYVAGTDSSNVPIAGLGIALDIFMKNRAEKSAKLRDEYDKKLAKYDALKWKEIEDAYHRSTPEYKQEQEDRKLKLERDAAEFAQKQKMYPLEYQYKQAQIAGLGKEHSGGSGSGGTGRVLAGDRPLTGTNFTKDQAKAFTNFDKLVSSQIVSEYGTPEYVAERNQKWAFLTTQDPSAKVIYDIAKSNGMFGEVARPKGAFEIQAELDAQSSTPKPAASGGMVENLKGTFGNIAERFNLPSAPAPAPQNTPDIRSVFGEWLSRGKEAGSGAANYLQQKANQGISSLGNIEVPQLQEAINIPGEIMSNMAGQGAQEAIIRERADQVLRSAGIDPSGMTINQRLEAIRRLRGGR